MMSNCVKERVGRWRSAACVENADRLARGGGVDDVAGLWHWQQEELLQSNGKCGSLGRLMFYSDCVTRFTHLPHVRRQPGGHLHFFLLRVWGTSDCVAGFLTHTGET